MSISLPPIALASGQVLPVPPSPNGQALIGVVLSNLSPFALEVQVGLNFDYLQPFTAAPYPLDLSGQIPVVTAIPIPGSGNPGTASLLVTYYYPGDTMPQAAVTLVSAAISAAITGAVSVIGGQGGGLSVQVATPPKLLGTVTILAGQFQGLATFSLDPNATGVAALVSVPTAAGLVVATIQGASSGFNYAQGESLGAGLKDLLQAVVLSNVEQITLNISVATAPVANTAVCTVYETFGAQASTPVNSQLQPLAVAFTQPILTNPNPPGGLSSVGAAITSTGSVEIVTGVAGMRVSPRKGILWSNTSTSGSWALRSDSGVVLLAVAATQTGILPLDFERFSLPYGDGVQLVGLTLGATIYVSGYLTFDQA